MNKIERAYLKCRPTIIGICASFIAKRGGEPEDVLSDAYYYFMLIYHTHDPSRAKLEADVQYRLTRKLMEGYREETRKRRVRRSIPVTEENVAVDPIPYFDIGEFMSGLSADAREVVKLVFNRVPDVELEIAQRGESTPTNINRAIRQYLIDCRWTIKQVRESFSEIRSALSGD